MAVVQAVRQQGQLPAEANEFVGREAELRLIASLLFSARLVTLTGPGGVGKTRVAFRAAATAAGRFRDGVRVVELSALRDPELLSHTVAQCLGLPEQSSGSQRDALLAYLRDRRLLLILDTCEHLIDACADLAADVLAMAPGVTVLATSREPLDVDGESTCPIPPLPESPAAELFARRAAAALGGFTIDAASRADVIRICQAVDGIPLAIELAAGRLHELTLAELRERTHDRLALLTGGSGERHATARSATAWSYDICTAAERTLWARLSVFPGGFDAVAAIEVCAGGDLDAAEVYETIIRLVDKSVLVHLAPPASEQGGGSQQARFRMLDTIREFGAEQLAASGHETAVRDRHLARYLALARGIRDHFLDDDQLARFAVLDREQDSIRAALEYALDGPQSADARLRDGAELAIALYPYWMAVSQLEEGKYWLAKVLTGFPGPTPQRAWALIGRCYLGALQGETADAVADGRAGVALAETLGAADIAARGYLNLGLGLITSGQLDEAATVDKQAEERLTAVGDRTGLRMLCIHDGHRCQLTGQPEQTLAWYQRFENDFGPSGERWLHAWMHMVAAMALFQLPGKDDECQEALLAVLAQKHELNDTAGIAYAFEILGWLAARGGRHARASWLLGAADTQWTHVGARVSGTPVMEQYHQQAVTACRAALGTRGFDTLAAQGAGLTLARAVALATADTDDPDTELPTLPNPPAPGAPTLAAGTDIRSWNRL